MTDSTRRTSNAQRAVQLAGALHNRLVAVVHLRPQADWNDQVCVSLGITGFLGRDATAGNLRLPRDSISAFMVLKCAMQQLLVMCALALAQLRAS